MKADVAIIMTTWFPGGGNPRNEARAIGDNRYGAAHRTLRSWLNAGFPGTRLHLVIADDGSVFPPNNVGMLAILAEKYLNRDQITQLETPRLGTGGAFNAGLRHVFDNDLADVVMYAADDWTLERSLDLAPSLALLRSGTADVVRLGPTHPNLRASVQRTAIEGAEWCLRYDWSGGGYVFGHRPALHHRRLYDRFGMYVENASAIEVEREYNERLAADPIPPIVMHAPNCTLAGPFHHIDTTELGEDDPATLTARYS